MKKEDEFQDKLLLWYEKHHRQLPWRENHDAYRIWLSEIMLQQTQVATVIDYFNAFIKKYPTILALSQAEEEDVLKQWEGLGYYSRARRLIPCAKMVVEEYGGHFPQEYKEIIKLPGVGSYTAGAILSIAFNKRLPAVDGNVMRVYSRLFDLEWDISEVKSKKYFEKKVQETLPEDCRHFNQALMELGAVMCTPKNPSCIECPIQLDCQAYEKGRVSMLPIKTKKIKKKLKNIAVLYIKHENKILLVKRPNQGLLAGMWGFLTLEIGEDLKSDIAYKLMDEMGLEYKNHELIKKGKHVFTHLIWEMSLIGVEVKKNLSVEYPESVWIEEVDMVKYAIPVAFKKLL